MTEHDPMQQQCQCEDCQLARGVEFDGENFEPTELTDEALMATYMRANGDTDDAVIDMLRFEIERRGIPIPD